MAAIAGTRVHAAPSEVSDSIMSANNSEERTDFIPGDSLTEDDQSLKLRPADLELAPELIRTEQMQSIIDSLSAGLREPEEYSPVTRIQLKGLPMKQRDSLIMASIDRKHFTTWTPVPRRAVILSMLIPGGGQIYNRKYWKLPIFYGGYLGCVYALTWNNQAYQDYMQAYLDIMDDDPETKSYMDFLPASYDVEANKSWLSDVLKNRKDMYRRYRDISIFCFAGVYLLSIIDAYVDAELSHFDVSRDLSLDVNPGMLDAKASGLGVNLSLTF